MSIESHSMHAQRVPTVESLTADLAKARAERDVYHDALEDIIAAADHPSNRPRRAIMRRIAVGALSGTNTATGYVKQGSAGGVPFTDAGAAATAENCGSTPDDEWAERLAADSVKAGEAEYGKPAVAKSDEVDDK